MNNFEKILQFAADYFSEYFNLFFATLTKPSEYLKPIEIKEKSEESLIVSKAKKYKLDPQLLKFVITNTAIGAVLFLLTPDVTSNNFDIIPWTTFSIVLWTIFSVIAYSVSKILGGKGTFLDTVSFCFQIFSSIHVLGNLATLLYGILLASTGVHNLLVYIENSSGMKLENPSAVGRIVKTIMALFYLPLGIRHITQLRYFKLAVSATVVILSVICFSILLLQSSDTSNNLTLGLALAGGAGAQETIVAEGDANQNPNTTPEPENTASEEPAIIVTAEPEIVAPQEIGPSGKIIYIAKNQDGKTEIMIANADGSGEPIALTNDGALKDTPVLSPDGQHIAYAGVLNGVSDIYLLNINTRLVTRLSSSPAKDGWPSWSPDGRLVTFESFRDGNFEIYAVDVQSLVETRLTDDPAGDGRPTWSPDSRWLLFVSNRDGGANIYRMDADGSNVVRLTDTGTADASPAWSPDSQWIAFTSWHDGNAEIYVMRADGSDQRRLTSNNAHDDYPVWSPDGQHILYTKGKNGNETLVVMDSDGSNALPLISDNTPGVYPAWSPDGLYVTFQGKNNNQNVIYVADLSGNLIAQISQFGQNANEPIWVP